MLSEDTYFQDLTEAELWQRYCGFLDLSIDDFMDIQRELLMDQMDRIADSTLGKKIMGDLKPKSVDEFRRIVPLTTYDDYEPYLSRKQEDALAEKPYCWCHSSGRGGHFKWIPYTSEFIQKITVRALTTLILASCTQKGQVNILPGMKFLLIVPPAPYVSGTVFQSFSEHFSFRAIPPPEMVKNMEFQEKIQKGFQIALEDGVDLTAAIGSVLVRVGEQFSEQARGMKLSKSMLHPRIVHRLLQAWLHAKKGKRAILPKDLWPTKAILTAGVDIAIYKDDIAHYWGVEPYEFYMCAEVSLIAAQIWTRKGLFFVPDLEFLEFIPYEKQPEHQDDSNYQPSTVLLSEVEEGKLYEVVVTQFYGMPLLRYRLKDIVKIIALRDDETGVNLPQMVFQRKVGETINLASLANLDEKTIWRAIASTGIGYTDWSACKEYDRNQSFLRLYLELKEKREAAEVETMIHEQLEKIDTDYRDVNIYLGLHPVRVTLLSPGTFQCYMNEKRQEGADLAHLKPTHINPSEEVTRRLLQLSEANTGKC